MFSCVLSVFTLPCETLTLTIKSINKIHILKLSMEKLLLEDFFRIKNLNDEMWPITGVVEEIMTMSGLDTLPEPLMTDQGRLS